MTENKSVVSQFLKFIAVQSIYSALITAGSIIAAFVGLVGIAGVVTLIEKIKFKFKKS